ncbi:MAG: dienelactone hydrolase family protein [Betaproteobacteria bacterium]|nr:dienelactone hydrolase family protein [Betaproteobacteria bacterium]
MRSAGCVAPLAVGLLLQAGPAASQGRANHADLVFPKEATELSAFSPIAMGIWKPAGAGPFPALVIVHSCGGLKQQLGYWRSEAIKRGYVAFIIDAFSARGAANCRPSIPIPRTRGVKDILDAAAHIKTFPFVDRNKVGMIGFSWGATTGLIAGSRAYAAEAAPGREPVAATVSLYPNCFAPPFGGTQGNEFLRADHATPTLLLMGELDTETPPSECLSRLPALKARDAPVEWHVYKDATHCWDCADQHNQHWSPPWAGGRTVQYRYDGKITEDSAARAFEFLNRRLGVSARP